jgi:DNA polymerase/3'-5' exonuclease PolX
MNVILDYATSIALTALRRLKPACERICIAGSIRRHSLTVKDVEIVYLPKMGEERTDLFTYENKPQTEARIAALVRDDFWRFDQETKRNGPKYKRLVHNASEMVIELFRSYATNWGLIMALRTGPAAFNKLLVTSRQGAYHRGAMPGDMYMRDGHLWKQGRALNTPTETSFFTALGLPYWPPQERSAERLRAFLDHGGNA